MAAKVNWDSLRHAPITQTVIAMIHQHVELVVEAVETEDKATCKQAANVLVRIHKIIELLEARNAMLNSELDRVLGLLDKIQSEKENQP